MHMIMCRHVRSCRHDRFMKAHTGDDTSVHKAPHTPCLNLPGNAPQELYGNVPRIRTPRIMWAHTARRVLCMEWIDGVKLTDKAAMAAAGLDIIDFVDVGIECTLRQLLESGLFHADPHP